MRVVSTGTPSSRTTVVNLRNDAPYDVYCGRPGHGQAGLLGNPYRGESLGRGDVGRREAVARFACYFKARVTTDKEYALLVESCRGRVLGCFCAPQLWRVMVIAYYLNVGKFWEGHAPGLAEAYQNSVAAQLP